MSTPQEPPYIYPTPPQRRKHRVWPWVLLGVFGVLVLVFGGCTALVTSAVHQASNPAPQRSQPAAAGSQVRDGKFAFQVTQVDPPMSSVGDTILNKDAQGEYVPIHVTVTNIGNVAQGYFGSNQKLIDDQGREYSNDTAAEAMVNKDDSADINPGNQLSVIILFDVPKDTVPAAVEFHDSAFSGGVRVALK
ncbi:DUF4352 domain-containing protein [Nocardia terpenica]|uniref:DUF4352 domain-containing protein n=2 Tax=Nocardia terpenica TaxID=455432 RepID=A0A6G9ZGA1_9NOCA|nr:DUF4352 domain-containing protein [Nocardia terpenica]